MDIAGLKRARALYMSTMCSPSVLRCACLNLAGWTQSAAAAESVCATLCHSVQHTTVYNILQCTTAFLPGLAAVTMNPPYPTPHPMQVKPLFSLSIVFGDPSANLYALLRLCCLMPPNINAITVVGVFSVAVMLCRSVTGWRLFWKLLERAMPSRPLSS